jgi:hypothetical protein
MGELGNHFHNHNHCNHNLRYCEHCDIVYCASCNREWGVPRYHFTTPYIWYWSGTPYTITWGSNSTYTITNSYGQRVTDNNVISAYNLQAQTGKMSATCTHN